MVCSFHRTQTTNFKFLTLCEIISDMIDFKENLKERFLRYVAVDSMSDPSFCGKKRPTTDCQKVILEQLAKELEALGLEVYLGPEWVVMATLKATAPDIPTIGFMAHVDTADDVMGNGVKAQVFEDYDGSDIILPSGLVIPASDNPEMARYKGGCIITSDGTTLLGSDDKAGVAVIMEIAAYLSSHPGIKHGDIEIFFTPDEETGSGMDEFPYDRIRSTCCYTVDGASEGEIETECFNAATVKVTVKGNSIHLGSARGRLVNAVTILSQIVSTLPQAESPEATDGRYGYICPLEMSGTAVEACLDIFIRDFDLDSFYKRIEDVKALASAVSSIYRGKVDVDVHVSYHNMAEINKRNPKATSMIYDAALELGIELHEELIRGGTDGARLAARKGISCPNIYTGGHNLHSLSEWVALDGMNSAANLVLGIIRNWGA